MELTFDDLRVGMKVLMKDDYVAEDYRDEPTIIRVVEEMEEWRGRIVTVSYIDGTDDTFRIAEEDDQYNHYWYWIELVECVVAPTLEKTPLLDVLLKGE